MATANLLQTSVSGGNQNALSLQGDGVFFPKASTASRLALTLTTTDKGLIVYDTTDNNIYFWNGAAWESIPGSGDAGANGSVQYNDNGIVSGATNFVWDKVNGRVGIGAASPAATVSVLIGSEFLHFGFGANNDNYYTVGSVGSHLWRNGGTEQMRLNTTANLVLKGGTTTANGVGVTFPAVQVPSSDANCLDDYEEGTWTGTLTGGTTNPTTPVTATGRYTKIGRVVTVQINYTSVNTTGASGIIGITGLPFANNGSSNTNGAVSLYLIGTFTGSPFASVGLNESFINIFANISNGAYSDVTHNAGTPRFLTVSITYTV